MQTGVGRAAANTGVSATARPTTPLVDILDAMSRQPGSIGVATTAPSSGPSTRKTSSKG